MKGSVEVRCCYESLPSESLSEPSESEPPLSIPSLSPPESGAVAVAAGVRAVAVALVRRLLGRLAANLLVLQRCVLLAHCASLVGDPVTLS